MAWIYYLILLLLMLVGWFINILGLPGLWLMVAAYGGFFLATHAHGYVGWTSMIALIVLALIAEAVEFLAGAAGSKAAGARKRGMIGAIVGGFLGAIFLSVIPIPVVAQVVGACLGAFIGAAVMELSDKGVSHSLRVGVGAAKGRFYGIVSKLAFGGVMFLFGAFAAVPIGGATPTPPLTLPTVVPPPQAPGTSPATAPTTEPSTAPTTAPATTVVIG